VCGGAKARPESHKAYCEGLLLNVNTYLKFFLIFFSCETKWVPTSDHEKFLRRAGISRMPAHQDAILSHGNGFY
jgi:hypothetical protein